MSSNKIEDGTNLMIAQLYNEEIDSEDDDGSSLDTDEHLESLVLLGVAIPVLAELLGETQSTVPDPEVTDETLNSTVVLASNKEEFLTKETIHYVVGVRDNPDGGRVGHLLNQLFDIRGNLMN